MCYAGSCNPSCGKCRPKRIVEVACPYCGAPNMLTREEFLLAFDLPHRKSILERKMLDAGSVKEPICTSCGACLIETYQAAVTPRTCTLQGVVCGFPCGRCTEPPDPDAPRCRTMVPVGKPTGSDAEQGNYAKGR